MLNMSGHRTLSNYTNVNRILYSNISQPADETVR